MADTAFVMLSGVANDAVTQKAGELGANSIIRKPVLADDLKQRLETLVHEVSGSRIEWDPSSRP
jgi:CheY-like chemotaxis protein